MVSELNHKLQTTLATFTFRSSPAKMLRQKHYVVIGAGVSGLTTAFELKRRERSAQVTILAKQLPGDTDHTYCSAWAGANWVSSATDNGAQEDWDRATYLELEKLSRTRPETGVRKMTLRSVYDEEIDKVGILSKRTGKIWYEDLAGLRYLKPDELPEGAKFGYDISTFIIDASRYLLWYAFLDVDYDAIANSAQAPWRGETVGSQYPTDCGR